MKAESNIKINTFENFIEDESNKFAFAACRAIIDKSVWEFNPLWLYGPSGCGKTHLLNAIAHEFEFRSDGAKNVLLLSANLLVGSMINIYSYSLSQANELWPAAKSADVLIVDNAEYLFGKPRTQEEIALLSMRKQENGTRTIIASCSSPRELPVLEHSFRNRIEESLIVDIQSPSPSLKNKYVKWFLANNPFSITDEAKKLIVTNAESIPQLSGFLQKAFFQFSRDKKEITATWVKENKDY